MVINFKYRKITTPKPTPQQSKLYISLAREMHEANPSISLRECLRIIIERHKENKR